jgi:photosystem II stability/assembly factor-like uncharacterized protein
MKRIS